MTYYSRDASNVAMAMTNFSGQTDKAISPTNLSVSELVQAMGETLESKFSRVSFQGEISEFTKAASGHLYFTVKDENAQVSAVMWRGVARNLQFTPEPGMAVVCQGKPNIYPRSGRLQMVVSNMQLAGEGLLQKKFLELKDKLEREGLFDQDRKREMPFFPKVVGVVTSAGGAAIHDIMTRVQARMPNTQVVLYNARVQGPGSVEEIVAGIKTLNKRDDVEVIVVGRGGGSLEDLWSFNEEAVVRAVFASRLPIISAVGHEVDTSLSDLAADLRAPTPTAAGEMVVPSASDLTDLLNSFRERLDDLEGWFYPLFQELDDLQDRLTRRALDTVERAKLHLDTASARISSIRPDRLLQNFYERISAIEKRFALSLKRIVENGRSRLEVVAQSLTSIQSQSLERNQNHLAQLATRLEAVSPVAVLKRGYSIVERKGEVIAKSCLLKEKEQVTIVFSEGSAQAQVLSTVEK